MTPPRKLRKSDRVRVVCACHPGERATVIDAMSGASVYAALDGARKPGFWLRMDIRLLPRPKTKTRKGGGRT